jgi:hypothetical protein
MCWSHSSSGGSSSASRGRMATALRTAFGILRPPGGRP